jgi:hypothetical protein
MASGPSDDQQLNFGAAALGWVFPGLGHLALGERARGIYAMIGVLILFFGGILIGGLDAIDKDEDRLWFVGQAGVGPIAFAAAYANNSLIKSGRVGELLPSPASSAAGPDRTPQKVSSLRGLAHPNEFGTLFAFLAGLMNLVVILDALVRVPAEPTFGRRAEDRVGRGAG